MNMGHVMTWQECWDEIPIILNDAFLKPNLEKGSLHIEGGKSGRGWCAVRVVLGKGR